MVTFFDWVDSHIGTTSDLLYQTVRLRMSGSPITCLICSLLEKVASIFCPRSANTGCLIFSVDDNWYSNRSSCMQCIYYTCFRYFHFSWTGKICFFWLALSSSREVQNIAFPPPASSIPRGQQLRRPQTTKPERSLSSLKSREYFSGQVLFFVS